MVRNKRGKKMSLQMIKVFEFLGIKIPSKITPEIKSKLRYETKKKVLEDLGYEVKSLRSKGIKILINNKPLSFYVKTRIKFPPFYPNPRRINTRKQEPLFRNSFSDFIQIFTEGHITYKQLLQKTKTMKVILK